MAAKTPPRLGIATGEAASQLTEDDQALRLLLQEYGYVAQPAIRNDSTVDWSTFDAGVTCSRWSYYGRPTAFRDWHLTAQPVEG